VDALTCKVEVTSHLITSINMMYGNRSSKKYATFVKAFFL